MTSGLATIRAWLAPLALGLALAAALLAVDAWLGYRKMAHGGDDERVEGLHRPHPRLGWTVQPGTAVHEKSGSFVVEYQVGPDGLRRVPGSSTSGTSLWLFGDSFTFGHGVADADTWPSLLARDWLAPGLRVRNAGVMAYGLAQQVQRLAELADRIEPGDRVLFAPLSADLERSLKHFGSPSKALFRTDKGRIRSYPDVRDGRLVTARFDTPGNRVRALLYNALLTGPGLQRLHHAVAPPRAISEARVLFDIARRTSEARGARFGRIFLPHPRECARGTYQVDLSSFDFPDLMGFFPSDPDAIRAIHLANDPHWNPRGHAMAARAVAWALLATGVVDEAELARDPRVLP